MSIPGDLRAEIRGLLKRYQLAPSKGLGQNLLADGDVLADIVKAAELSPDDTVLEIGPGLGLLTRQIALRAGRVVAVELDQRMVALLRAELDLPNIRVVEADILAASLVELLGDEAPRNQRVLPAYKVVANLPYYITSAVLRRLLETLPRPASMVLMVQWEVAERLASAPGTLSLLAVSVQVYGEVKIVRRVPAVSFYPPPKVDSAVISFHAYPEPVITETQLPLFFRLAKAGFGQKRKQLRNSLAAGMHKEHSVVDRALSLGGIDPARRAETLTLQEWRALCEAWPVENQNQGAE